MAKDKLPKISIVLPVLNSIDFIERSIKSVVEQDYPDFELFIKDGGSSDGTLEIIKEYAKKYPKIIKWFSGPDNGQSDAINIGLKYVKGELLTYLNGDDLYKIGTLKKVGNYFLTHPDIMWAYGMCDIIDKDDKPIRNLITSYKNLWLLNYSFYTLLILNYISQMGVFWRREAYLQIGLFDKDQHYVMDYDYWLRLGEKFNAGVIKSYLASFRVVPTTKSSTGFIKQFKQEFNVSKKHTKNKAIIFLHFIHFKLIIFVYSVLKLLNNFRINYFGKTYVAKQ